MIEYNEESVLNVLFRRRGSLCPKAMLIAFFAGCFSVALVCSDLYNSDFRIKTGLADNSKSQMWSAATGTVLLLLAMRTNRSMARFWEGTGLLHQMRGEWFDSVSCCVTFTRSALDRKHDEVQVFRHTIVRMMSLCHGSALEEIGESSRKNPDPNSGAATIDALGLDEQTLLHLQDCKEVSKFNRVEVLLHMTQVLITQGLMDGILEIPPPILSRVYQTLSRGFVNLLNAKKIVDTRFPFPYAQLILILLIFHAALTATIMSSLTPSPVFAFIFTFVPVFGLWCLNLIAIELENPFGQDDNDLPLNHFQNDMNNCLLMLLHEKSDILPSINPNRYADNLDMIRTKVSPNRISTVTESIGAWQEDRTDASGESECTSTSSCNPVCSGTISYKAVGKKLVVPTKRAEKMTPSGCRPAGESDYLSVSVGPPNLPDVSASATAASDELPTPGLTLIAKGEALSGAADSLGDVARSPLGTTGGCMSGQSQPLCYSHGTGSCVLREELPILGMSHTEYATDDFFLQQRQRQQQQQQQHAFAAVAAAAAAATEGHDGSDLLHGRMVAFNEALRHWTSTMDRQTEEMRKSLMALRHFGVAATQMTEATPVVVRSGLRWEGSQRSSGTLVESLDAFAAVAASVCVASSKGPDARCAEGCRSMAPTKMSKCIRGGGNGGVEEKQHEVGGLEELGAISASVCGGPQSGSRQISMVTRHGPPVKLGDAVLV